MIMKKIIAKSDLLIFIFLLLSSAAFGQWTNLGGPPGGSISDIEYSATTGTAFTLINGKIFISANDGASWTRVATTPTNLYSYDLLSDGATLYSTDGPNFYKSVDNGTTWVKLNSNGQYLYGNRILKIDGTTFAVYSYSGMFVSADGGVTWAQISKVFVNAATVTAAGDLFFTETLAIRKHPKPGSGLPWASASVVTVRAMTSNESNGNDITADPSGNLYVTTYQDILKSVNNGASWTSIKGVLTESYFYNFSGNALAMGPAGLYLLNQASTKIYLSVNQGSTWTAFTNYPSAAYSNTAIEKIAFGGTTKLFAGTSGDGVFLTATPAAPTTATWSFVTNGIASGNGASIKVSGGAVGSGGRISYATGSRGLWGSTDGNAWTFTPLSNNVNKVFKMPNSPANLIAYGTDTYTSSNSGASWSAATGAITNVLCSTSAGVLYGGNGNVNTSTSNGATWTPVVLTGMPASYYIYGLDVSTASGTVLFAVMNNYTSSLREVWKITLSDATHGSGVKLTMPSSFFNNYNDYYATITGFFLSGTKLIVGQRGGVFISTDSGATWKVVTFSNTVVVPITGGMCVSNDGSFYITKDDGLNWSSTTLPGTGYITDIDTDGTNYFAAAQSSPALKFTGNPVPATTPTYINFNWTATSGPYGGSVGTILVDNSNNVYAANNYNGNAGNIYKTGPTFTPWVSTAPAFTISCVTLDKTSNTFYGFNTSDDRLYTSTDATTWTAKSTDLNSYAYDIKRLANGNILTVGYGDVYLSTDGGVTFGAAKYHFPANFSHFTGYPIEVTSDAVIIGVYDNAPTDNQYFKLIKTSLAGAFISMVPLPVNYSNRLSTDNAGTLYTTTSADILKSTNDGTTWTSIKGDYSGSGSGSAKVFVSPANVIYVADYNNKIYKSTNGGTNWTGLGTSVNTIYSFDLSGTNLVMATSNGISISTDGGTTIIDKSTGFLGNSFNELDQISPTKLVAVRGANNYVTTNGGTAWTIDANSFTQILTLANGSLIGYTSDKIMKSVDGGVTWTLIGQTSSFNTPFNIASVVTVDGSFYFAVDYQYLYYSTNLTTWTKLSISGLPDSFSYQKMATDTNGLLYVIVYNATSQAYEAYQVQYGTASKIAGVINPASVEYINGKIYLYDRKGVIFTTDDGSVFQQKSSPAGDKLIIAAKGYFFIPVYGGTLWLSRDQGDSWQNVGLSTTISSSFTDVAVNEFDGYAYGLLPNSAVRKSANIVIPSETVAPQALTFTPSNGATNADAKPVLSITFDEPVKAIAAKTLKIIDAANTIAPFATVDVSTSVQNGKTFTFPSFPKLSYTKTYFVIVDNGAFEDIFGNKFAGITSPATWRFTVKVAPDTIPPSIAFAGASNIEKGTPKTFQATITDAKGVTFARLNYRGVLSKKPYDTASMTLNSGKWEVVVSENWMDKVGLEYYFSAKDAAKNVGRTDSVAPFHSYISYSTTSVAPTIPGLTSGGKDTDYRIFSIPHKLADSKFSTVFDELGSTNNTKFRILTYKGDNKWSEYGVDLTNIAQGVGYWINMRTATPISVTGASTPELTKTTPFSIILKPGWNEIGNPYPFEISWNLVRAGNAAIGKVKKFAGQFADADDKLGVFQGGFVYLSGSAIVPVVIPFSSATAATPGGRIGDPEEDQFANQGWLLPLTISSGSVENVFGGVGMHQKASEGFDQFDDVPLPHFASFADITFAHPEDPAKEFSRDIFPVMDEHTWIFEAVSSSDKATLTWDNSAILKMGQDVLLLDETTQTLIDMKSLSAYGFSSKAPSRFRIYFGHDALSKIKPTKMLLGLPFPNPSNGMATIPFSLPDTYSKYYVSLDLLDFTGRSVKSLVTGSYSPGFYVSDLNSLSESLNAGFYIVRLSVNSNDYRDVQNQKIVIQK
jgi:Bacterial Ig-like domain